MLEAEIAIEQGAGEADRTTDAPAPSRADVGKPATPRRRGEDRISRRERRREERGGASAPGSRWSAAPAKQPMPEKQRGAVITFFCSVRKELQKVQWPDRDTLVQASAVTILFVAVAAAYLGVLDAIFSSSSTCSSPDRAHPRTTNFEREQEFTRCFAGT